MDDLEKLRLEIQNKEILKKVEQSLIKLNEDSQRRQLTSRASQNFPQLNRNIQEF
ncbi:hypothetical protein LEP1GSC085_2316 [Leptospira interrogans str. L0996]|nr:hypothetical protein LEP1GSC085_2316 [Leptospira interrogans str. L0996]